MILDNKKVYLLLGSNMGDREQQIKKAIEQIGDQIGKVTLKSSVYETAAWGKEDQPGFLNIALEVETTLEPLEVLNKALDIEQGLGRVRQEKWGSRLIDIDIIFFADTVVNVKDVLQVPHPEMQNRKFVLEPLAEIIPDFMHPVFKRTISEILQNLQDNLPVSKV